MRETEGEHRRVVVLGSANADLVLSVGHRPAPGETLLASTARTTAGGKGANQAVAAARMGARVSFVGCVGRDGHGELLRTSLEQAGVDLRQLTVVDEPTGYAVIMITPDGENAIVVAPGANAALGPVAVDVSAGSWAGGDVVVAQLEIPMTTVDQAARRAEECGARFVLNAAPAAVVAPSTLALCDPLVVNEQEATALVEQSGNRVDVGDGTATARAVLALGPRSVIVTLGAEGAVVATAAGTEQLPAPRVRAVDTTGAGDGFVGALTAELSRGARLVDAARVAVAYAAAAVTRPGAQAAYLGEAEFRASALRT